MLFSFIHINIFSTRSQTYIMIIFNYFCSCGEQIRDVRHKHYLTSIRNLLSRLPPGWHMLFVDISVWTREGLPAEKTLTLKSAKNSQKVKSRN